MIKWGKGIFEVKKENGTSFEPTIRGLNKTLIIIDKSKLFYSNVEG